MRHQAPKMIPVYGHRYFLPDTAPADTVMSICQTNIICVTDLADCISIEFSGSGQLISAG